MPRSGGVKHALIVAVRLARRPNVWQISPSSGTLRRVRETATNFAAVLRLPGGRGVFFVRMIAIAVTVTLVGWPTLAGGQISPATEGYFGAVSEHFHVSLEEVRILGEWRLSPEEIPVVLFVAARAGVSPDAVATLRGDGQSWDAVIRRFGLRPVDLYVPFAEGVSQGILARAYEEFGNRPQSEWDGLRLRDQEIIALVNIQFLAAQMRVPPERVLEALGRTKTFVGAHRDLGGA
ncbi:MAG: hypothetical protein BMS9Abin29_1548 [Gemmatimonadota bacterium]|nr:MAG: hypothetical protein BMS9Abin29_1548 [Gemmatimonadota bacterium]